MSRFVKISKKSLVLIIAIILLLNFTGCNSILEALRESISHYEPDILTDVFKDTPTFSEYPYVVVNENKPIFSDKELTPNCVEKYSELDELGRCGVAFAVIGKESMPTGKRQDISHIRPTGWHTTKYDIVSGKYLYNRCHLIAYQLTNENANAKNLITGTRYMNEQGMLPFENLVADYIKETDNHVAYRVSPVFKDDNLLAYGVQIEALSIEDNGAGICFNIYCFNAQPNVLIDYNTGESSLEIDYEYITDGNEKPDYILDSKCKEYHLPSCEKIADIENGYKLNYIGNKEKLKELEYSPCKKCKS